MASKSYDLTLTVNFTIEVDDVDAIEEDIESGLAEGDTVEEVVTNEVIQALEDGADIILASFDGTAWTVSADRIGKRNATEI